MPDLEARVARLEELLARLMPEGAQFSRRNDGEEGPTLEPWIRQQTQENQVFVFAGVIRLDARATASRGWGSLAEVTVNLRRTASICTALSSEPRLAMLQELMRHSCTTAELMEALGFDRGQLYHHLRDLFVQAMVEQPERGRYSLTSRGAWALLVAGLLAGDAPVATEIPQDEGSI